MGKVPIISVTGTKGKTTTVAIIDDVLRRLDQQVMKVDTTGHFVNGQRKSTLDDSKAIWHLVPSVCPGRYLWEFHAHPELCERGVAVLECALGSSAISGLGYRYHDVGVFLNVFEDHIGSSERIQSKADIVKAKEFIFSRLQKENSYAVFNADDSFVISALGAIPGENGGVTHIPVGLMFDIYDLEAHLNKGGIAITMNEQKQAVIRTAKGDAVVADLTVIPWTFDGNFTPSVWNILSAIGALYGYYKGQLPQGFKEAVEQVRLDRYGGRLTVLKTDNNIKIIADYAHEKISLTSVARLARTQLEGDGRVIGVVRLAHDRTDDLIIDTGKAIAPEYDELIVYDKIDGHLRKATRKTGRFIEVEGRTSQVLYDAIKSTMPQTTRIIREDEAIRYAASIAKPGDVVVIIVNDDIERSIAFIQDSFKAEFI
ncbi:MAG: hypothetical protein JWM00_598 [Candidatus Saccharibacteria bacterium]|nr:hypothetical protein [Candidatus Saccharibacteria bacterium]